MKNNPSDSFVRGFKSGIRMGSDPFGMVYTHLTKKISCGGMGLYDFQKDGHYENVGGITFNTGKTVSTIITSFGQFYLCFLPKFFKQLLVLF